MRIGAALVLALAAAARPPVVAQHGVTPFVVATWAEGDALIPFAEFDGQQWSSSWPRPSDVERSRALRQIPASWWGHARFEPAWELLDRTGARRTIQITGTTSARMGSECSLNIGLTTDAPAKTFQYGTVLAASRPGVIEAVQALTSDGTEWRAVNALLPDLYRRHEAEAWKDMSDFRPDLTRPLSRPKLADAFVHRDDEGEFVYFDSEREFARRPGQLGEERSAITGWLWRRSPTMPFQAVRIEAGTRDPDGKGAEAFHPLGAVRDGARRFWLGSMSGYDYSALVVLDVRRAAISRLILVEYPGC